MLIIVENMRQLCFSGLMHVYQESNVIIGREKYRALPVAQQQIEAEQEFYHYLSSVFFRQKNARYVIWEENGRYLSALRLEPYHDGFLLCAVETVPELRRKGYAEKLLVSLLSYLEQFSDGKLYSHVSKKNVASLALHKKCGFQMIKDYATHLDGSVFRDSVTLLYKYKKAES